MNASAKREMKDLERVLAAYRSLDELDADQEAAMDALVLRIIELQS